MSWDFPSLWFWSCTSQLGRCSMANRPLQFSSNHNNGHYGQIIYLFFHHCPHAHVQTVVFLTSVFFFNLKQSRSSRRQLARRLLPTWVNQSVFRAEGWGAVCRSDGGHMKFLIHPASSAGKFSPAVSGWRFSHLKVIGTVGFFPFCWLKWTLPKAPAGIIFNTVAIPGGHVGAHSALREKDGGGQQKEVSQVCRLSGSVLQTGVKNMMPDHIGEL